MADFPVQLTGAVDGPPGVGTPIMAKLLNDLEAKVGIDGSVVTTSLDYLLKNPASINPGHKHSRLCSSDGSLEAVIVDASGNVGFGTASPAQRIHIEKTGIAGLTVQSIDNTTNSYATVFLTTENYAANSFSIINHAAARTTSRFGMAMGGWSEMSAYGTSSKGLIIGTRIETPLVFGTNGLERMRLLADGNVGIGKTAPGKKLDVNGYARAIGIFNTLNSAPADGDLEAGECALWFDKTDGAAKLMIKAKQNDGAVKTGSVSLA